jgi:hypothetical protein
MTKENTVTQQYNAASPASGNVNNGMSAQEITFEKELAGIIFQSKDDKFVSAGSNASEMRGKIETYLDKRLKESVGEHSGSSSKRTGFANIIHADPALNFAPEGYVRVDEATAKLMIVRETISAFHGNATTKVSNAFSLAELLSETPLEHKDNNEPLPMHGSDNHCNAVMAFRHDNPRTATVMQGLAGTHEPGATRIAEHGWAWGTAAWLSALSQHSPESLEQKLEELEIEDGDKKAVAKIIRDFHDQDNRESSPTARLARPATAWRRFKSHINNQSGNPDDFKFDDKDSTLLKKITSKILDSENIELPPDIDKDKEFDHTPYIISLLGKLGAHTAITRKINSRNPEGFGTVAISIAGNKNFDGINPENVSSQLDMVTEACKDQPVLVQVGNYFHIKLLKSNQKALSAGQAQRLAEVATNVQKALAKLKEDALNTDKLRKENADNAARAATSQPANSDQTSPP